MAGGLHIVMLAGEAVPFAKAGGLADVLGALPRELEKLGLTVTVVIPRHRMIDLGQYGFEWMPGFEFAPFDVHRSTLPNSRVEVFLIGNDRFFGRTGIYTDPATGQDYPDQADRWIFFQRSALDFVKARFPTVDILHCHDHQTGLIPAYLEKFHRGHPSLGRAGSVFTIHNIGYQGVFPAGTMALAGFDPGEFFSMSPFEFHGMMNFMKIGLVFSDAVTTVSETYAKEIQLGEEYGYGLEGVVKNRTEPPIGILNGIDPEVWNPATDQMLPAGFTSENLKGKQVNKRAVLRRFGLDESRLKRPLLAMISRIEAQKGFDLVLAVLDEVLARDVSFVLLGTGNKETESKLRAIVTRHPQQAGIRVEYSNELSHLMEAGADIFLMPSKYEPCGLNQMYSMRYGTVPVVRATGGLADTVQEFERATGRGTGFRFDTYAPEPFKKAIFRALSVWEDEVSWSKVMLNGMKADFSWTRSAARYAEVYERASHLRA